MNEHTDWLLPPDLEFIIIDCLLGDKSTLASCSLVCSRWLPPSRKHLFRDVTIQLRTNTDPVMDFLHIVKKSGEVSPGWAIGAHVKTLMLEGRFVSYAPGTASAIFTLGVLRALLSALPHLASLWVTRCLVIDDSSQQPDGTQYQHGEFELDELIISDCSGPTQDPGHLLAPICTFSSIGSLSVHRWGRQSMPGPLPTFSSGPVSPPIVRSLDVEEVEEAAARALYALVASSPSITNACLTRISVHLAEWEEFSRIATLANLAGTALRDVVVRVDPDIRLDRILQDTPLTTCTALSSLTLSVECIFEDPAPAAGAEHAEDARAALHQYAQILGMHRVVFTKLTLVRLEMRPVGWEMCDAFVRVVQDICRVWPEEELEPHEVQRNVETWAFLEHVLCDFPALERVEFVLYETLGSRKTLTEAEKVKLKSTLEGRLPRLGQSGIMQLVFEY